MDNIAQFRDVPIVGNIGQFRPPQSKARSPVFWLAPTTTRDAAMEQCVGHAWSESVSRTWRESVKATAAGLRAISESQPNRLAFRILHRSSSQADSWCLEVEVIAADLSTPERLDRVRLGGRTPNPGGRIGPSTRVHSGRVG